MNRGHVSKMKLMLFCANLDKKGKEPSIGPPHPQPTFLFYLLPLFFTRNDIKVPNLPITVMARLVRGK